MLYALFYSGFKHVHLHSLEAVSTLGHYGPAKAGCPYLRFVFSLELQIWTQKSKKF